VCSATLDDENGDDKELVIVDDKIEEDDDDKKCIYNNNNNNNDNNNKDDVKCDDIDNNDDVKDDDLLADVVALQEIGSVATAEVAATSVAVEREAQVEGNARRRMPWSPPAVAKRAKAESSATAVDDDVKLEPAIDAARAQAELRAYALQCRQRSSSKRRKRRRRRQFVDLTDNNDADTTQ
jgi:hypothetical protein